MPRLADTNGKTKGGCPAGARPSSYKCPACGSWTWKWLKSGACYACRSCDWTSEPVGYTPAPNAPELEPPADHPAVSEHSHEHGKAGGDHNPIPEPGKQQYITMTHGVALDEICPECHRITIEYNLPDDLPDDTQIVAFIRQHMALSSKDWGKDPDDWVIWRAVMDKVLVPVDTGMIIRKKKEGGD